MNKWMIFLASPVLLLSNPTGEQVVSGTVNFETQNQALNITASDGALIHWKDFSIGSGEITRFIQPNSSSIVMNKVMSSNPSQLLGLLDANGKVFLINPSGILVGKEASIHVGSFIASTLDITQLEDGKLQFQGDSKAAVINLGKIETLSGDALLIGHIVENHGTIECQDGVAGTLALHELLIKPTGKNRFYIEVPEDHRDIEQWQSPFEWAFAHPTDEEALVFIENPNSSTETILLSGGTIRSQNSDETGGEIVLLGDHIALGRENLLDTSQKHGGGEISIGGETHDLIVTKGSVIQANATEEGDGGTVIFWSHSSTYFEGSIEAKGGGISGDGGFVEISSQGTLIPNGTVTTLAPNGKTGTLLFDPTIVSIQPNAGVDTNVSFPIGATPMNPPGPCPGFVDPVTYTFTAAAATIDNARLGSLPSTGFLNCNNVIIDASLGAGPLGSITVNGPILWDSNFSLTLISPTTITVNPGADIQCGNNNLTGVGNGNITLTADSDITILSSISNQSTNSGGGNITVTSLSGNITIGSPAQTVGVKAGSNQGLTQVFAEQGTITLNGGTGAGTSSWAIVGEEQPVAGSAATGDINIKAGIDLILNAGSQTGAVGNNTSSAYIGKMCTTYASGSILNSNITIDVARNAHLNGGTGTNNEAFIGHGGFFPAFAPSTTRVGDVHLNIGGNLELFGGTAPSIANASNGAWIGTGSPSNIVPGCLQRLHINVGGCLYVHNQGDANSGMGGLFIQPMLGGAERLCNIYQQLYLNVGKNTTLDGRVGRASIATYNAAVSFNCPMPGFFPPGYRPEQYIHTGGDLVIISGDNIGGANAANIYMLFPLFTQVWAGGNIRCFNGLENSASIHHSLAFFHPMFGVNDEGDFDGRAGGDIIVGGGAVGTDWTPDSTYLFFTFGGAVLGPSSCSYTADNIFASGNLWPTQSAIVNGSNIFTSTPLGNASGNTSTSAPFHSGGDGLGAIRYDTDRYVVPFATFPAPTPGNPTPICGVSPIPQIASLAPGDDAINYVAWTDINMLTADRFDDGTPADVIFGSDPNQAQLYALFGNLTVSHFRNTTILSSLNAGQNVLVITQNDLNLIGGLIQGGNNVDLVVDNQEPNSPSIGLGSFNMDCTSRILSGAFSNPTGYLRIYTARQGQNTICSTAFINGASFGKGTLFADSDQEIWCTYYPDGIKGILFTFFYKDCLQTFTEPANLVISQFITDEFMDWPFDWPARFRIYYDRPDLQSLSWNDPFTGNELLSNERYWIQRRTIKKLETPKINRDPDYFWGP